MLLRFFILFILLIKKSTSATNDELKEELRLVRQDIGLLMAENKNQSDEIALLKGIVESQNTIIDEKIVQELNKKMKDCAMTGDETLSTEQKQAFRVIPSVLASANTKNCRLLATVVYDGVFKSKILPESSTTISPKRLFHGPPTGCSDLSLLGYTLNGFYQVKSDGSDNSDTKLDTVFCAFNQPEVNHKSSIVENRIVSRRDTNKMVFHVERSTDLEVNPMEPYIPFEVERVNLGNAFDVKTGTYTIPKSGLYLFFFKGMVIFPPAQQQQSPMKNNTMHIHLMKRDPLGSMGAEAVNTRYESYYTEFGKLVRVNRGDGISVWPMAFKSGTKISGRNMSFTGYFYEELI